MIKQRTFCLSPKEIDIFPSISKTYEVAYHEVNFWDFLNLHWKDQISQIVFCLAGKLNIIRLVESDNFVYGEIVTVDEKDLAEKVVEHVHQVAQRMGNYPTILYVGHEVDRILSFNLDLDYYMRVAPKTLGDRSKWLSFRGIRIQVILCPWMEGYFAWHPNWTM